ncbi:MAG TPA: T3SS effector HopA1 family protein [Candidatus Elarobacter sp.]|nr:T3SS effector HopA1 family protein [Candidatus Elarobacter sp.]
MSAAYDAQLRTIVDAVAIETAGTARVTARDGAAVEVTIANERGPFLGLAEMLYGTQYNVPRTPVATSDAEPERFLAELRAANRVPHRVVQGALAQREMITAPTGHYVVLGRPVRNASTGRQVRFYWNVSADGGPLLVRELSSRFEYGRVPFQAKVPVVPSGYDRVDTGVLYLNDEDVAVAAQLVAAVYAALGRTVRPDVPLFTQRLAPGLAFAESPPTGDSFGMHRCDLIAEGLVRAFERGASGAEERVAVVRERLTEYGLDAERLALNAAARYPYRFGALSGLGEAA